MGKIITDLLTESVETLTEDTITGGKATYIRGIFMQAEVKNRNGRIYPKAILEHATSIYIRDYVTKNRALSELSHPTGRLNIDPREVSHLITELWWDGNNVMGKARVLENHPVGAMLKGILDGGAQIGVSSRASGSVKKNAKGINIVQEDLRIAAIDAVVDPSAPDAFVDSLMESADWIYQNGVFFRDGGELVESSVKQIKKSSLSDLEETKLRVFENFLNGIK